MSIIAKDKFDVMVAMTGEEQPQFTGGDARQKAKEEQEEAGEKE